MSVGNAPPNPPGMLSPADLATGHGSVEYPLSVVLSWEGSDPNGDALTYDAYLGEAMQMVDNLDISTQIAANSQASSLVANDLDYATTYYWKVVARDQGNLTGASALQSFTTRTATTPILILFEPDRTNNALPTFRWEPVPGV